MEFDRFVKLVGIDNFGKIKQLKVMVVGVGGVGGYVVESLARCGVGTLIIMDPDIVDVTNINRQIVATYSTVGDEKCEVLKSRILDINKDCQVICINEKMSVDTTHYINDYKPDYLVDACDDISAKKEMIRFSSLNKIPFISSMGTGKRFDPSKLEITTLDKTSYDPLAKILRKYVRDEGIKSKITVLASLEQPKKTEGSIIPSSIFVPASAGLLISSYIINKTIEKDSW